MEETLDLAAIADLRAQLSSARERIAELEAVCSEVADLRSKLATSESRCAALERELSVSRNGEPSQAALHAPAPAPASVPAPAPTASTAVQQLNTQQRPALSPPQKAWQHNRTMSVQVPRRQSQQFSLPSVPQDKDKSPRTTSNWRALLPKKKVEEQPQAAAPQVQGERGMGEADLSDSRICDTYAAMRDAQGPEGVNWMLVGYGDSKNKLTLYDSGCDGLAGLIAAMRTRDEAQFAYVRFVLGLGQLDDAQTQGNKYLCVTYIPDSVSGIKKYKANLHRASVEAFFKNFVVSILALSTDEIDEASVMKKLGVTAGQLTEVSQQTRSPSFADVVLAAVAEKKPATLALPAIPIEADVSQPVAVQPSATAAPRPGNVPRIFSTSATTKPSTTKTSVPRQSSEKLLTPSRVESLKANAGLAKIESNLSNVGGEIEKKAREACGGKELWQNAGQNPGIEIWRIENFKVVPLPQETYGSFYTGDSYILLRTTLKGNALQWDIHFWLGKETTQDESGTAAYKTVELDDYLGGGPVEHREVQDNESPLFLSYFPNGIRVLEGGIESGFHHVKPEEYQPRLMQLKGKRNVRLREVPLALSSVNSGDVFVLDLGLKLIQFNGKKSSPAERRAAAEICNAIKQERAGRPAVIVFEERDSEYPQEWVDILGTGEIASAEAGGSDEDYDKMPSQKVLLKLSDASGSLSITRVAEGSAVCSEKLDQDDAFILDTGREVFAWIGSRASTQERAKGMFYAEQYIRENGLNPHTPISRVIGGNESAYFLKAIDAN